MKFQRRQVLKAAGGAAVAYGTPLFSLGDDPSRDRRALVIVGPSNHPPGTHEVKAGGRLMADCVNRLGLDGLSAEVSVGWPEDRSSIENAATLVFIGDKFPAEAVKNRQQAMADVVGAMSRDCGIVCIHYATGLEEQHVAPYHAKGEQHPLLTWMGGYFATRCKHHKSIARLMKATIEPTAVEHPILRGWQEFKFDDEPYINNYLGPDGLAENVTPLATSMLPPNDPTEQITAWSVERKDGGRGVGIVMPHYYRNWLVDDLRTFVTNAIVWSAGFNVPEEGCRTPKPELAKYEPDAIEPRRKAGGY
ncbi:hypothetical protein [Stratiformator vulcanicus]|uniref:Trehalose utilization n=1 Tax=Stratiformator vulcanicus TaxID=2527980 RepID=A0A517R010_9PLAN|nr:hypothetical protein [Stratiformator vulcanicus]QDT37236.1 Trehalose utilization [Stratiformator vulcanicus]